MDLLSLFLFTESILAIILCFFFIGLLIALLALIKSINEVKKRMIVATDEVINTAEETRNMASQVAKTFTDYLIIKLSNSLNKRGRK